MPGSEPNFVASTFILLVVLGGVAWFVWIIVQGVRQAESRAKTTTAAADPAEILSASEADEQLIDLKVERIALEDRHNVDLRGLTSTRMVIRGTPNWINHRELSRLDSPVYALLREPGNRHDSNAVAVHHPSGRKLGFISKTRAMSMAPLLDRIGPSAFLVAGGMDDGRLRVDLPLLPDLRAFVKAGNYGA